MRKLLYLLLLLPFAASSQTVGIKVAAPIIKNDPSDNTVTGYAHLMNGGYTSVPTTAGRDSIVTHFSKRLRDGMIVYVRDDSTEYRWKGSTTAWETINHGGTWGSITGTLSAQTDLQAALNLRVDKVSTLVDARTYASLNAAVTAIGSAKTTLLITNPQTTTESLAIPDNISIQVIQGGSIVKHASDTLVINGNFDAGYYKVFTSYNAGDITFGKAAIDYAVPQWWGLNTTPGTTNMTVPIQSAISSLIASGGTVKIPVGTYLVDSLYIPYRTGIFRAITIEGDGKWNLDGTTVYHNGTQLISNSANRMFAPRNHSDGVTLRNIYLNGNNVGTYGWYGLYGSFATIENCLITKFVTAGVYTAQGLCQLKYNYITQNGTGVLWASDGSISHNRVTGNTGNGLTVILGGNFIEDNEIEGNGAYGLYINGTAGTNSNNVIKSNYFENNLGWHIFLEGQNTGNRTVSKTRITDNYLSNIAVGAGNTMGGIKLLNVRSSNISTNNFIGSFIGTNTSEQQALLLENTDLISVTNFVGENGYRNALKILNSTDVTVSDLSLRDFAYSGTTSDDAYGIYIDASCLRVYLSNISMADYRGGSGYMKGIKALSNISLTNYAISTPVSSPDSFSGSLLYKSSGGGSVLSLQNNSGTETISATGTTGTLTATTLVKAGGTSVQFLKADGSVDASTYLTTTTAASTYLPFSGGTLSNASSNKLTLSGGSTQNGITFSSTDGNNEFYMFNGNGGLGKGFGIYNVTTSTLPFYISNASDATIAGSVTAAQFNNGSGNIIQNNLTAATDAAPSKTAVNTALALKQNLVTLTTTGTSGAATFNQSTGALNIPQYAGGGVTSITGTANQVVASASTGAITLSLPQSIATTSTPQFGKVGLGLAASSVAYAATAASTSTIGSYLMTPGVAYTGTVDGMRWYETTNSRDRLYKSSTAVDYIHSGANYLFTGTGTRAVTANATGDLATTTPIVAVVATDSDVITAITGATYSSNRATITPASGKIFYAGQIYDDGSTYTYIAIADNVVRRF